MSGQDLKKVIFLSALEPSADAHCAGLIKAFRSSVEFAGLGGPKMAEAGCALINEGQETISRAVMAYNAFGHVFYYYRLLRQTAAYLAANKVDLVIVCDSPAFNFHVAKAAKKLGIKTLFYIAPQLWAWAPWRINKLKKYCDKLCCILPFELEWFTSRGVPAEFVGNPLFDELATTELSSAKRDYNGFEAANARIAIIPGSRSAEVGTLWRPMQQIAIALRKKYHNVTFTTVAVDTSTRGALDSTRLMGFRTNYVIDAVYQTARDCDFALVASGSATLQVASAGCPMVIMYKTSPAMWRLLGRWLIATKYLSLVNILADRQLVPEFMPYFRSIDPIVETIRGLFEDKLRLTQTSSDLLSLIRPLADKKAGSIVARIANAMLT
ncbi:MAG: lipid-A-disaccharide synthase [Sedimentisphaerales bacterium]|nr:lipid-A-disaccharide synthase [Sedimentisphaerales bacterium]